MEKYLIDIGKIDLLTLEEETELVKKIKEGDQEALEKLVRANLRFVVSVAKQYQNNGLSLSDLINEGNVGLLKAAKRFDETRGFKFISYAVWWIRQAILNAIVEYSRIVRMPVNKLNAYTKLNDAISSFVQEFEREPTLEELSDVLNMSVADIHVLMNNTAKHLSTDAPVSEDEGAMTMVDTMTLGDEDLPDLELMRQSVTEEIKLGLSMLAPREADVLADYFGISGSKPLSLEEVGEKYNLTRERVRQIRDRSLRRLRKRLGSRAAFDY